MTPLARSVPWLMVIALWSCAGHAASIETLVMPGPLAEAHAELEDECSSCHAPFDRMEQKSLCLDCHEDVAADIRDELGFHGTSPAVVDQTCRSCHLDHIGRDADIRGLSEDLFQHEFTDFALTGQHSSVTCASCHESDELKRDAPTACISCHGDDEPHDDQLGDDCGTCHSPDSWSSLSLEQFDHGDFLLDGAHGEASCSACHVTERYSDASRECVDCHAPDDVHDGRRGLECGDCHTPDIWELAAFDHDAQTDFALRGQHAELVCANCHLPDNALEKPPKTCSECHLNDDIHLGLQGSDCGSCHNQTTWGTTFDHEEQTGFPLPDNHSDLACSSCHVNGVDALHALPTSCNGCHSEDDPHEDPDAACGDCHVASNWAPAPGFHHDLTSFGLIGGHRLASCEQCHDGLAFSRQTSENAQCVDCHEDDDQHSGRLGGDCQACHTVVDWSLSHFNHDRQTDFALTGAHDELACLDCHGDDVSKPIGSGCRACHADDDVHDGLFGSNCSRCHANDAFETIQRGVLP